MQFKSFHWLSLNDTWKFGKHRGPIWVISGGVCIFIALKCSTNYFGDVFQYKTYSPCTRTLDMI